jgi:sugar-specific transcriptional regulator TrmB
MELEEILKNYGLKDKQAKVYLACLQVGSGPVLKIAQTAGLARSTTELVLNALVEKSLVSTYNKKKVKYFTAENPRNIIADLKTKTNLIEESLPKLLALYGQNQNRPAVRFYEGKQGIETILAEILDEAKELLSFGSAEDLFQTIETFPQFVAQRVAKNIPIKLILKDSEKARERKTLGKEHLREVKLISKNYNYHGLIYIWNDKIAMFSLKDQLTAVVTESHELTQVQRSLFMSLWDKLNNY